MHTSIHLKKQVSLTLREGRLEKDRMFKRLKSRRTKRGNGSDYRDRRKERNGLAETGTETKGSFQNESCRNDNDKTANNDNSHQ